MTKYLFNVIALYITFFTYTQLYAQGYNVGDAIHDFTLKDTQGNTISLRNYKEAKGFIIVFMSNHCPFAKKYESRLLALQQEFAAKGYILLAINSNDATKQPEDSYEKMQEKNYPFPYLYDNTQKVAHQFGATKTPQVFLLQKKGHKIEVVYTGAIDDRYDDENAVTERYLAAAIAQLLQNQPISITTSNVVGCGIKWK
jgi:peroxiredoxin